MNLKAMFFQVFLAGLFVHPAAAAALTQPVITAATVDMNAGTVLVEGFNFPAAATLYMGRPGGGADKLVVADRSASHILANLKTTEPGTYVLAIVTGPETFYTSSVAISKGRHRGSAGYSTGPFPGLAAGDNYIFPPGATFSPGRDGTCLVWASAYAQSGQPQLTDSDVTLRTAVKSNNDAPQYDTLIGPLLLPTTSNADSTSASVSYVWDVVAGNTYLFGCFVGNVGAYESSIPFCRVTWDCE